MDISFSLNKEVIPALLKTIVEEVTVKVRSLGISLEKDPGT